MTANNLQITLQFWRIFTIASLILTIIPQQSTQQQIISKSDTIEAHCIFNYDPQDRYGCYLYNIRAFNPTDVLVIVGTHLPGRTDADVEVVVHTNCRFNQFNGEILRTFVNLKRISLVNSGLQSINPSAFDICNSLEFLNLATNSLTQLHPQMFRNCVNLTTFSAFRNQLSTVPEDLFSNNRNLELFNVQLNRLSELSPRLLSNAINLQVINIASNNFNDPQGVMNILNGHLRLRSISLFGNLFSMFNLNFFSQFQSLEFLEISRLHDLTGIQWQALPGSLMTLSATNIREPIPHNAFHGLPNLTNLFIAGSGITDLHQDTFRECRKLESLMITDANIKTIQSQLFASQSNLRDLWLHNNSIEVIEDGAFVPLVNLGLNETLNGLSMSVNKIRRLSLSMFGQHPHLRNINFGSNEIAKIERGIFSRFNPVLSYVSFLWNDCVSTVLSNVENLDGHNEFEWCFNNFEGITTTTPNGVGNIFKKLDVSVMIFIGIGAVLMYF